MKRCDKRASVRTMITVVAGAMTWFAVGCAAPSGSTSSTDDPAKGPSLEPLAWLTGAWGSEVGGRTTEEYWTPPRGGTMFGVNRTLSDDRTTAFEFLRIVITGDEVYYLAAPGGRHPPTAFKLVEQGEGRVVFENHEHDFPQRIIYWRAGDALHARIEGVQDERPASMEWTWQSTVRR
jgi:hypothetical protein